MLLPYYLSKIFIIDVKYILFYVKEIVKVAFIRRYVGAPSYRAAIGLH